MPRPWMEGGVKQMTRASVSAARVAGSRPRLMMPSPCSLFLIEKESWPSPLRSSQCLRPAISMPLDSPAPLIMPKPAMAIVCWSSGRPPILSRRARTEDIVRSSEAPSGRPMSQKTMPLSSSGRNEPGTLPEMPQMARPKAARSSTAKSERRTRKPTRCAPRPARKPRRPSRSTPA